VVSKVYAKEKNDNYIPAIQCISSEWKDVKIVFDENDYKTFADFIIITPNSTNGKFRSMCYGTRRLMVLICQFCKSIS